MRRPVRKEGATRATTTTSAANSRPMFRSPKNAHGRWIEGQKRGGRGLATPRRAAVQVEGRRAVRNHGSLISKLEGGKGEEAKRNE